MVVVDSEVIRVECLREGRNPYTGEVDLARYLSCVKRMTEEYISKYGLNSNLVKQGESVNGLSKPLTRHDAGVARSRSIGLDRWLNKVG